MSIQNQRVFLSDNGVLSELSDSLNDFRTGDSTVTLTANEDYIYVASDLPFNHRYFDVKTANDNTATVKVEIWWNNAWHEAVDVLDRTLSSGKSLAVSGIIQWMPDESHGWDVVARTADVAALSTLKIFCMYWMRFSWSATLKTGTALKYIGYKFSTDAMLTSMYPDLANTDLMTAFATGKTDWNEQHFMAGETIIADLRRRQIIASPNQIMDYELFAPASCHKVAEIIYRGMGRSYFDDAQAALARYESALDVKFPNIDRNMDGRLSESEKTNTIGWMRR